VCVCICVRACVYVCVRVCVASEVLPRIARYLLLCEAGVLSAI
jgi:hypothetical protein